MDNRGAVIIEGHIQGLSNTRSLGEAGIPVYVVDKTDCIASHSVFCTKFFRCPDFIEDAFAEFLVQLAEREKIRGWVLLPSNDHAVLTLSRNKTGLETYYKLVTPEIAVIDNIYDKSKLLRLAGEKEIPIPRTFYFNTAGDPLLFGIKYPLLIKGRYGLSFYKAFRKKAFLSLNEQQLRNQLKYIESKYRITDIYIQELIAGNNKTVSFTAFCIKGEILTYWMGEKIREHPIRFGTATYARSVYIKECLDQSSVIMKALNYTGVCEIEYLLDPGSEEYKLLEINARTWLWVGLAKECGVDYVKIIYDFVNGEKIHYPVDYDLDKYWRNLITDLVYSIAAILTGRLRLKEFLRNHKGKQTIDAVYRKDDIKPAIYYLFNLFTIFTRR